MSRATKQIHTVAHGYTIMELAAVVAVLGILAGFTIPAFLKFQKSSRIDQAKAVLNASIADCLQTYRTDPDSAGNTVVDEQKLAPLNGSGYVVDGSKNKCNEFWIKPSDSSEDYLFPMGFMVRNGKVIKIAIPAKDRGSETKCKSWGTCGIPPELQAEWDRLAMIEAEKKACNDEFYDFLNSGNKGQKNVWDETSQSCSRAQWVLDGTRYTSKEAYDAAFTAKVGKECIAELLEYTNSKPPNGRYVNEKCDINTYFFNGKNLETSDSVIYEAKVKEYNDQQCSAEEQKWLSSGASNVFTWSSGLNCTAKWKCNNTIYTDESSYKASSCGAPPPPPPPPTRSCLYWFRGSCLIWS